MTDFVNLFSFCFQRASGAIFGAHVFAPQKLRSEPRGVQLCNFHFVEMDLLFEKQFDGAIVQCFSDFPDENY